MTNQTALWVDAELSAPLAGDERMAYIVDKLTAAVRDMEYAMAEILRARADLDAELLAALKHARAALAIAEEAE